MNIYTWKKRFDPETGKPTVGRPVRAGICCDYCGMKQSDETVQSIVPVHYSIFDFMEMEQSWYNMEPPKTPDGKSIDLSTIYEHNDKFAYCEGCEVKLAAEWLMSLRLALNPKQKADLTKFLKTEKLGKPFKDPGIQLCMAMYAARHRVIEKLLKTMTLDELNLDVK